MSQPAPARSTRPHRAGRPPARHSAGRAFTLVEMLVVIAVIAALIGLLLAGLQSAQRSGKRTKQMSDLRQVFNGWAQYAGTYGDSLMPGYMDDDVQQSWRVTYKYKDGTRIPTQYTRTYPWRLLPYLDGAFPTLFEYLELDDDDALKPKNPDGTLNTAGMALVSEQPAFGYNAYYLGGWWTTVNATPTLTFGNATWTQSGGTTVQGRVVATKLGGVTAPDRMIAFCASSFREPGFYKMENDDAVPGAAWVVPTRLGAESIWRPSDGTTFGAMQATFNAPRNAPGSRGEDLYAAALRGAGSISTSLLGQVALVGSGTGIEVLVAQAVPQRRFGSSVSCVQVDGSTGPLGLGELTDQSRWMNPAGSGQGAPGTFQHSSN